MRPSNILISAAMAFCVPVLAHAHGDVSCNEPTSEWQYKEELEEKLKKEGWKIRRIKIDKGCYEVYGFDDKGKKRESYFNPKTLELVTDVLQHK